MRTQTWQVGSLTQDCETRTGLCTRHMTNSAPWWLNKRAARARADAAQAKAAEAAQLKEEQDALRRRLRKYESKILQSEGAGRKACGARAQPRGRGGAQAAGA